MTTPDAPAWDDLRPAERDYHVECGVFGARFDAQARLRRRDGSLSPASLPAYTTSRDACAVVEAEMERHERVWHYLNTLLSLQGFCLSIDEATRYEYLSPGDAPSYIKGDTLWTLLIAPPAVRCRAALRAVGYTGVQL